MYKYFARTLFRQLFSSYMYVEKAAETTFIRKICKLNVDEIDTWKRTLFFAQTEKQTFVFNLPKIEKHPF